MAPSSSNYTLSHFPVGEQESSSSSSSLASQPQTRTMARDAIVSSLVQILEQPLGMLRNGTVGDRQMAYESQLIPGSSFGKHLRHVHDHYKVLLNTVEASSSTSNDEPLQLDYDKRMRAPPLETSAKAALAEFEQTQQRVRHLLGGEDSSASRGPVNRDLDRAISLSATTPAEVELGSTLGREMWFVCLHAIHHFALARVILVHELGLKIDDEFGVAPSTLLFREWNRATQSKL